MGGCFVVKHDLSDARRPRCVAAGNGNEVQHQQPALPRQQRPRNKCKSKDKNGGTPMEHTRTGAIVALLAGLATGLAAPATAENGVIRIGISLRMIVENGLKYGQMAKDELEAVNAEGGINGKKVEVILLDDECKPDKGVANVNRFIYQNKVHLVMGSVCSSVSMPQVDITTKEEVPQIVSSSTNAEITKKGSSWVFRTSVSERFYASVHAKYLSENAGKKVAYLDTTDTAGIGFARDYLSFMRRTYNV